MGNIKTLGLGFGDETKGSFIDYLASEHKEIDYFVKYNGGCQASHTVKLENNRYFKFCQLSPSMQSSKNHTILSSNFIINLDNLINECLLFSKVMGRSVYGILSKVHIDYNCICVTPLQKVYNILEETFKSKRGSVGTGVSIAGKWSDNKELTIRAVDLIDCFKTDLAFLKVTHILENQYDEVKKILEKIQKYKNFKQKWESLNCSFNLQRMMKYSNYLEDMEALLSNYNFDFCNVEEKISSNSCIFESSQGFLLDKSLGIYPNITYLDTTMISLNKYKGVAYGFIRSYFTRHGKGFLITEDTLLNTVLCDKNQEIGMFNGKIRFGWLDCVLLRYGLKNNNINELYMSCLDSLALFKEVKLCTSYRYMGKIDSLFSKLFEYKIVDNTTIISNIKLNSKLLIRYLKLCEPIYENIKINNDLFFESVLTYVSKVESLLNTNITILSFGENRDNKLRIRKG